MSSLPPVQPDTFTYPNGVLIGDLVRGSNKVPPYGNDNIPTPTLVDVGGTLVRIAAVLELQSTTAGLLFPRMTTAQRTAIPATGNGLAVYDTDLDNVVFFRGGAWDPDGGGDVNGPANSGSNALAVYADTTGKLIANTLVNLNPVTSIISGIAQAISGAGSAASPTYSFSGDPDSGMFNISANVIGFGANGATQFSVGSVASAVNYVQVIGGATGDPALLTATGPATDINMRVQLKGGGNLIAQNGIVLDSSVNTAPAASVNQVYLNSRLVTASVGQTTTLNITSNTANIVFASVSNVVTNKICISINGVVYYLLASTATT